MVPLAVSCPPLMSNWLFRACSGCPHGHISDILAFAPSKPSLTPSTVHHQGVAQAEVGPSPGLLGDVLPTVFLWSGTGICAVVTPEAWPSASQPGGRPPSRGQPPVPATAAQSLAGRGSSLLQPYGDDFDDVLTLQQDAASESPCQPSSASTPPITANGPSQCHIFSPEVLFVQRTMETCKLRIFVGTPQGWRTDWCHSPPPPQAIGSG